MSSDNLEQHPALAHPQALAAYLKRLAHHLESDPEIAAQSERLDTGSTQAQDVEETPTTQKMVGLGLGKLRVRYRI